MKSVLEQHSSFENLCEQQTSQLAEIVRSFNTWAYKREQPSSDILLAAAVTHAVTNNQPIPFVLYWGKGPRATIATPDIQCLDYIHSLGRRVQSVYAAGAQFTLLLTDTHARHNQHSAQSISTYYTAIEKAACERGYKCRRLSEVVASAAPDPSNERHGPPSGEIMTTLIKSAAKWYKGCSPVAEAAQEYFRMNMREKKTVEKCYPTSIFITFNGSDHRVLFPDGMPIFYMYSLKKGFGVKPWFLPDPGSHAVSTAALALQQVDVAAGI